MSAAKSVANESTATESAATAEVHVIATLVARPGAGDELAEVLGGLIAPTRNEPGCRRYELLRHADDADRFTFVETWASGADLASHFATAHFQAAGERLQSLVASPPEIARYRRVG